MQRAASATFALKVGRLQPSAVPAPQQGASSHWRVRGFAGQGFEHTYFMLEAAASALGIGIASHALVEHDLQSGRLVAPFGFTPTGRSYCVLHARHTANNPKIAAFRSWIVDSAGDCHSYGEDLSARSLLRCMSPQVAPRTCCLSWRTPDIAGQRRGMARGRMIPSRHESHAIRRREIMEMFGG
jgi:hypothetical protein